MWLTIFSITSFLTVAVLFWIEIKRLRLSRKYRHVPGIAEMPIIGNKFIGRLNTVEGENNSKSTFAFNWFLLPDITVFFYELQVAPVSKFFISFIPVFLISDPETLKEIFNSGNIFSDHPYVLSKLLRLEKGLITSSCKCLSESMTSVSNFTFL